MDDRSPDRHPTGAATGASKIPKEAAVWIWPDLTLSSRLGTVDVSLLPYDADRGPMELGNMWCLSRPSLTLRCALRTHPFGWELRASAGGELARSAVCRAPGDVFRLSEEWRHEALSRGWSSETTPA